MVCKLDGVILMFWNSIKVKSFALKGIGIIINKEEKKSYIFPRSIPMEIMNKKIVLLHNYKITLRFKDKEHRNKFLNQIGINYA